MEVFKLQINFYLYLLLHNQIHLYGFKILSNFLNNFHVLFGKYCSANKEGEFKIWF